MKKNPNFVGKTPPDTVGTCFDYVLDTSRGQWLPWSSSPQLLQASASRSFSTTCMKGTCHIRQLYHLPSCQYSSSKVPSFHPLPLALKSEPDKSVGDNLSAIRRGLTWVSTVLVMAGDPLWIAGPPSGERGRELLSLH